MTGPEVNSGNGNQVLAEPMTDEEYRWEPVPGAWSVRRQADGPAPGAERLVGAGEWGRDPYGSDTDDVFLDIVWWVNQEVLHHGAEIALLRDLYRYRTTG
jgi:hypothetical protein